MKHHTGGPVKPTVIPALTVCQPYAHVIMLGEKPVENRNRPLNHRGPLLIHAGKGRQWLTGVNCEAVSDLVPSLPADPKEQAKIMTFGAVVAIVNMVACVHISEADNYDDRHQQWMGGPFCYIFDRAVALEKPVPYLGSQGLFYIPADMLPKQVHSYLEAAK